MHIGRHMPVSTSAVKAAAIAEQIGCNAIQIFASNPTGWSPPAGGEEQSRAFAEAARQHGLDPIVLHAPYLINLATRDNANWEKSLNLLRWTLQRGGLLGASFVVFHVGSHKGAGVEIGVARIVEALNLILPETPPEVMLLLENSVGAGNVLGGEFEHLASVLQALPNHSERLGVCLDTAHLWGAGYDISTADSAHRVLNQFDEIVGLAHLKVLHLNDSEKPLGSHRDVHARIGEGMIALEGFRALLTDPRLSHVSVLMETPIKLNEAGKEDWEQDREYIYRVKLLMQDGDQIH